MDTFEILLELPECDTKKIKHTNDISKIMPVNLSDVMLPPKKKMQWKKTHSECIHNNNPKKSTFSTKHNKVKCSKVCYACICSNFFHLSTNYKAILVQSYRDPKINLFITYS